MRTRAAIMIAMLWLGACAHQGGPFPIVPAALETPAVGVAGDAADDPAIWVAPDPAQSRVIGTQKQGGLFVYNLAGAVTQEVAGGRPNNVDLRDGFPFADGVGALVATSDRSDNSIALYKLDPVTGLLDTAPRARIATGWPEVYGVCLGRMGADFIAVATSKIGEVGAWRLSVTADGTISGQRFIDYPLGSIAEGCVVDDALGRYYVAQELVGLWRADLSDPKGASKTLIDSTGKGGNLVADAEGVALWVGPGETGYVILSVQGASRFAVYDRGGANAYRGAFRIGPGAGADGVSGTDGIEVVSTPLPGFTQGLFVVQDDRNTDPAATQDFKFVSWSEIATALGLD